MSTKNLVDEDLYFKYLRAINPKHLELRLFATEKCNFRCTYCYEDFELGRMASWVRQGVKNLMEQRCANGLHSLYISWFGGEPLLAMEVIEEIETFKNALKLKYPNIQPAPSGITTNGYLLTPEVLAKLVSWGVTEYQITLDGSEEQHNVTRLRADGAGTYAQVFGNLKAAAATELSFNISIRMHLHSENLNDVRDNLKPEIIRHFAHDPRFTLNPICISNYGGAFEVNQMQVANQNEANRLSDEIQHEFAQARSHALAAKSKPDQTMMPPQALPQQAPSSPSATTSGEAKVVGESGYEMCYATATNSFAIRADGNIVKCTTALTDPRNMIGKIKESGELEIDQALIKLWLVGFTSGKKGELACPLYKVQTLPVPGGKTIIPIQAIAA